MPATNYTQPTKAAENKSMTTPPVMGIPRQILARVAIVAALLIALPASLGAQQPILVLSEPWVTVNEDASDTATYTVRLNTKPTGTVTVTLKSSDPTAVTVEPRYVYISIG